jgi:hypothetical protein
METDETGSLVLGFGVEESCFGGDPISGVAELHATRDWNGDTASFHDDINFNLTHIN